MSSYTYRKIWENNFGPIPMDDNGRPYEIHHVDGNRNNNNLENLMCVSIEQHYELHYNNGDYGACVMIAKRMNLPIDYISNIQKGIKRPGVGGVKKGTTPWNKGKFGYNINLSDEGKLNKVLASKNKAKIKDTDAENIRTLFNNKIEINDPNIGKTMGNGKILSYERAFCKYVSRLYDVSEQYIYRIIKGQSKIV